jgi:hypothetical protein
MTPPNHKVIIGIDILANHKPFSYVALDEDCRVVAIGQGKQEEILSYLAGQQSAHAAINAPSCPNMGLVGSEEVNRSLFPDLPPAHWTNLRRAEYEMIQMGIRVPHTAANPSDCSPWMRRGFGFYNLVMKLGYHLYPRSGDLTLLEVQVEACFWSLLGHAPYEAASLEGRLQRQMVLHQQKLPITDPMDFFEEVTRYKLLQGLLPLQIVLSPYELNAWMAAYTAWLSIYQPARVSYLGVPEEGVVALPIKK